MNSADKLYIEFKDQASDFSGEQEEKQQKQLVLGRNVNSFLNWD